LLILKIIKIFKKYYQSIVVMWQHMFSVPVMRTVWRRALDLRFSRSLELFEVRHPRYVSNKSKYNVYAICPQTQLSTRWYVNLLNINFNYMFRPQRVVTSTIDAGFGENCALYMQPRLQTEHFILFHPFFT
jgi:hypothetical protein